MPIWNIIGLAADNIPFVSDIWEELDTSTFSSTFGDEFSFVIGGTQLWNVIGGDVSTVFDWEELLGFAFSGGDPSLLSGSILGLVTRGALLGIGGSAEIVVGNDSSFNYGGESFSVNRNKHEFNCTVPTGHHASMPTSIVLLLLLGATGVLGASIAARIVYGLDNQEGSSESGSEKNQSEQKESGSGSEKNQSGQKEGGSGSEKNQSENSQEGSSGSPAEKKQAATKQEGSTESGSEKNQADQNEKESSAPAEEKSKSAELADSLLVELVPELESTWLEVMKLAEFLLSFLASLENEIATATENLQTATANMTATGNALIAAPNAGWSEATTTLVQSYGVAAAANVASYSDMLANVTAARTSSLIKLLKRSKTNAGANPQTPLVTQVNADQYSLNSSSLMMTTNKGPMVMLSQDYNDNKSFGGIALNASQVGLTAQGSSSLTLTREGFNQPDSGPGISLMTTGQTKSVISLIAQQKTLNSPQASVSLATDKLTVSFGSVLPNNSFDIELNETGVTIQSKLQTGPKINLGGDSILLQVGDSKLTISADGVSINATKFNATCGDTTFEMNANGVSEKMGGSSRSLNDSGHKLAAAESEIKVTNSAISFQAATHNVKIDANSSIQQTMAANQADGVQNNNAGVNQNN